jgi:hypothetical protein
MKYAIWHLQQGVKLMQNCNAEAQMSVPTASDM